MKESFLHYIWQFRKFEGATSSQILLSDEKKKIQILNPGRYNQLAGPDFFNAQVRIDDQLWAGNVEIHIKSSDWYMHRHETDAAYDNVILHVVWDDDCAVYDKANLPIPTLVLKNKIPITLLHNYRNLVEIQKSGFINCETSIAEVPTDRLEHWLERVYFERLEYKVTQVQQKLEATQGDWEAVLFQTLMRNFGTVINADAFEELAQKIPFKTVRKLSRQEQLEPVLLGLAGLLKEGLDSQELVQWKADFDYNQKKFDLPDAIEHQVQFFKLRPPNFPTIRLSQLAMLYTKNDTLFSSFMNAKTREEIQDIFKVNTSNFWKTHFTFDKSHTPRAKYLSKAFIDVLIINTIIPVQFAYARARGLDDQEQLLMLLASIPLEKNRVVKNFEEILKFKKDALHSQALLHLKTKYCDLNRCLQCEVGNFLIANA